MSEKILEMPIFKSVLNFAEPGMKTSKGLRANVSKKSHARLDKSETLNCLKDELAKDCCDLRNRS